MKYFVVSGRDIIDLKNKVQIHIGRGCKPQGGVCQADALLAYEDGKSVLLQAMIEDRGE